MANNNKSILIYTVSGSSVLATLTGNFDLRVSPYSSTGIAGVHQGGGTWNFAGLSDIADYKLYNTDTGTPLDSLNGGGTTVFFDGDLQNYIRHNGSIAFTANQPMGGFKFTGLGAGTTAGDSVRYEQVGKLAVANSWTALNTFNASSDGSIPRVNDPSVTGLPTSNLHLTNKYYVDTLFGTATGIRQSTHLIQCLPTSSLSDTYSRPTMELCASYLTGIGISSTQGIATIDATGNAGCAIDLDDGTSQWIVAGMHIVGIGRPVLVRRAPNDSLTVAGYIHNCAITDSITGTRSYTNFTFYNCHFNFAANNLGATFTNCNFFGTCKIQFASGDTLAITGCTGDTLIVNDDADLSVTGATQPVNIITSASANLGI